MPIDLGTTFALWPAVVTFVVGWYEWPVPTGLPLSERRNAISIVVRLSSQAMLCCSPGTVGRRIGDPPTALEDA